jgi:hypothetical protein
MYHLIDDGVGIRVSFKRFRHLLKPVLRRLIYTRKSKLTVLNYLLKLILLQVEYIFFG